MALVASSKQAQEVEEASARRRSERGARAMLNFSTFQIIAPASRTSLLIGRRELPGFCFVKRKVTTQIGDTFADDQQSANRTLSIGRRKDEDDASRSKRIGRRAEEDVDVASVESLRR